MEGYDITLCGKVFKGSVELKQSKMKKGYLTVATRENGRRKTSYVHRLVAEKFIFNPENKCCVNHKDANKTNNRIDNLEWVTNRENQLHALENDLYLRGTEHPHNKFTEDQVREIRRICIPNDPEFGYSALGRKYGSPASLIRRMVLRENWKYLS